MSGARHAWDDLTDDEIDAMAAASTEFPVVTDDDLARAVAVSAAGRVKIPISIRVDEEALDFFRAQGTGYQTRINDVLLRFARGELVPAGRVRRTIITPPMPARASRIRSPHSPAGRAFEVGTRPYTD
jgi:uncharacterized protein (DUF4415 family)